MTAHGSSAATTITQVAAGSISGAYSLAVGSATETWVTATLVGDTTVTISGLSAGKLARLYLTQDSTGNRLLTVSDGVVSLPVSISGNALTSSAITVYSPNGTDLVVSGGGTSFAPSVQTGGYTLLATDAGKIIEANSGSSLAVTVPSDASASFNSGDRLDLIQTGAGALSVVGAPGVAIQSKSGYRALSSRYGRATLHKRAAGSWLLSGDLAPTTTFDPTSVSGLTLWLKADALALNDGDAVGTWTDSSTGSHNATQSTAANKPTFILKGRNGLPTVRFDGVNDSLNAAGIVNDTAARTIFVVAARNSGSSSGTLWHLHDNAMVDDNGAGHSTYLRNEAAGTVDLGALSTLNVVTVRFNSTASADGYINGGSATNFNPNDVYQSPGTGSLTLGTTASASRPFPGDICEILIYNAALTDPNVAAVIAYLRAKWAF